MPKANSCCAANCSLFDHLVGAAEKRERHGEAKRLGSLEINDELDFYRLLNREVRRLLALEKPLLRSVASLNSPRATLNPKFSSSGSSM